MHVYVYILIIICVFVIVNILAVCDFISLSLFIPLLFWSPDILPFSDYTPPPQFWIFNKIFTCFWSQLSSTAAHSLFALGLLFWVVAYDLYRPIIKSLADTLQNLNFIKLRPLSQNFSQIVFVEILCLIT